MSMKHITMFSGCLHANRNIILLMKHNLLFIWRQYFLIRNETQFAVYLATLLVNQETCESFQNVFKESDIPVTISMINQWKLIDHVRFRNKKRKTSRDFKVRPKTWKKERSKTRDAFARDKEYNIHWVDSLKTVRKNKTCMWVLNGYIYSSNFSTRWKFHDTAKHLNCNVVTILSTNNSINASFVFW